jgi:predicted Zn-ribbon and HTH transcriptional regulator
MRQKDEPPPELTMNLNIEPDLKYCPQCNDEYRAEIVTCATCKVALLTGVEMQARLEAHQEKKSPRSLEIFPDEPMTTIRKGQVLPMKQLQAYLLQQGIPSLATKESAENCTKGCRGGELLLQVRTSDLREVAAALEQEYRQTTGLSDHDTSLVEAVYNAHVQEAICPACGFRFATSSTTCPDCGLCFA